jgi:hypothetical protein
MAGKSTLLKSLAGKMQHISTIKVWEPYGSHFSPGAMLCSLTTMLLTAAYTSRRNLFRLYCCSIMGRLHTMGAISMSFCPRQHPSTLSRCDGMLTLILTENTSSACNVMQPEQLETLCDVLHTQEDNHLPELTVRETFDFSGRCQGVGTRAGASGLHLPRLASPAFLQAAFGRSRLTLHGGGFG